MDKVLVISYNTFAWVDSLKEFIKDSDNWFEVIIICDDSDIPLPLEKKCGITLCEEARYAQRKHELFKIGRELKLKKLQNLRYKNGCIDIEKLTISIQLMILMNRYSKILYQKNELLESIVPAICKSMKVEYKCF